MQPSIEQCTVECYTRIFDGMRLKSYTTTVGFQLVSTSKLDESVRNESILVHHTKPE